MGHRNETAMKNLLGDAYETYTHDIAKKLVKKGDYVGHPFRGNQWTKGRGVTVTASMADDLNDARWKSYDLQKEKLTNGEKIALENYTRTGHQDTNALLRGQLDSESLSYDVAKDRASYIDSVFQKSSVASSTDGVVYRGIVMETTKISESWASKLKAGDTIEDKGFISTSTQEYVADSFSRNNYFTGVRFEIRVPKGTKIVGGLETESEIIINRGTKMRVVDVTTRERVNYEDQPWQVKVVVEIIP